MTYSQRQLSTTLSCNHTVHDGLSREEYELAESFGPPEESTLGTTRFCRTREQEHQRNQTTLFLSFATSTFQAI